MVLIVKLLLTSLRLYQVYLTISRRRRGDYKLIFTKPRGDDELVVTEPEATDRFSTNFQLNIMILYKP